MRVVISKTTHEQSNSLTGILKEGSIGMESTGESFRADFRCLDIMPFGFEGFGSTDIDVVDFFRLEPGKIYNLTFSDAAPPALFFQHCIRCGSSSLARPQDTICDACEDDDNPF